MTGLEIVGAGALYVVGVIAVGYLAAAIGGWIWRDGGLETVPKIVAAPILIWLCGAVGGLVLLGAAIR